MAKDAYYFPHDSNAQNDPKILHVIEELGAEGVGIFWMIIEALRDQSDHRMPLAIIPALARKWNTTKEKIIAVIKRYNLFAITDDKYFYSNTLIKRMEGINEHRKKLSEAGKKGNAIRWQSPSDRVAIAIKGKESKVNKIKVNKKREVFHAPAKEDVEQFLEMDLNKDQFTAAGLAAKFFNYYTSNGWRVGRNPMKDWKAAARNWVKNESKFENGTHQQTFTGYQKPGTSEARIAAVKKWGLGNKVSGSSEG